MAEAGKRSIFQDQCTLHATEREMGASLLPGTIVEADGDTFIANTADGTEANLLVLDYDMLKAGTVDDEVEEGVWGIARQLESGRMACVRLAAGQDVAFNAPLTGNGSGALRIADPDGGEGAADVVLCYAQEALDSTGATNALIRVRGK